MNPVTHTVQCRQARSYADAFSLGTLAAFVLATVVLILRALA